MVHPVAMIFSNMDSFKLGAVEGPCRVVVMEGWRCEGICGVAEVHLRSPGLNVCQTPTDRLIHCTLWGELMLSLNALCDASVEN